MSYCFLIQVPDTDIVLADHVWPVSSAGAGISTASPDYVCQSLSEQWDEIGCTIDDSRSYDTVQRVLLSRLLW